MWGVTIETTEPKSKVYTMIGKIDQMYSNDSSIECTCPNCLKGLGKGHMYSASLQFRDGFDLIHQKPLERMIHNNENEGKRIRITVELLN